MINFDRIKFFIDKKARKLLWLVIGGYILIIFIFLAAKYFAYGYNAIDLGIYGQVFYNSVNGDLFAFSIHPHSYLGDHFELFIILLLPVYKIFSTPLTLIFLQTAAVALSAWPLYLIARKKLSAPLALSAGLMFLVNPITLNLLFFEFHLLPFAILPLLFAFYFYYCRRFLFYLIFILLALLVREDVALVAIMFGGLALWEKRSLKWILTPVILGGSWFIAAMQLTGYFNQYGNYKFLSMYGWLGGSGAEIIVNIFAKPLLVLKRIFSLNNFFTGLGLLLPLAGLPLLKPKYFIPSLLVVCQLLLLSGGSLIILQTHYLSLVLPFLFIAGIFSAAAIMDAEKKSPLISWIRRQKLLILAVFVAAAVYSLLTLSPIIGPFKNISTVGEISAEAKIKNELIQSIGENDKVLSSLCFLPHLSQREYLYSLHYAFWGVKELSDQTYQIPVILDKLAVDFNDFNIFYLQRESRSSAAQYTGGAARIRNIIEAGGFEICRVSDTIALYEKDCQLDIRLVEKNPPIRPDAVVVNQNINSEINLLAWEKILPADDAGDQIIAISFYWQAIAEVKDDYQLELRLKNRRGEIAYQKIYPLAYGLYPSSGWTVGETIKTNYWFLRPGKYGGENYQLSFQLVKISGYFGLDQMRSAEAKITKKENLGPEIKID